METRGRTTGRAAARRVADAPLRTAVAELLDSLSAGGRPGGPDRLLHNQLYPKLKPRCGRAGAPLRQLPITLYFRAPWPLTPAAKRQGGAAANRAVEKSEISGMLKTIPIPCTDTSSASKLGIGRNRATLRTPEHPGY